MHTSTWRDLLETNMRKYLDNRDLVPDMALAPSSGVVAGKMQSLPEPKISL